MGETWTQALNRNMDMAQGTANVTRNSTAKYMTQATRELMREEEEQDMNGDTLYNHPGRDLTEVFQQEILDYDTPWNWLQARIDAEDFTGLQIGDYVPLVIDEKDWKAIIIGINTYKGFGSTGKEVGTHIDFFLVSDETNFHVMNTVKNNNSKDADTPYWWTSDVYAWLNALKIDVVSNAAVPMTLTEKDYTETGFILKLPEALQELIATRYGPLNGRYNSNNLATADNYGFWDDCGKLWLLNPLEITGNMIFSNNTPCRWGLQYPYFASSGRRKQTNRYWTIGPYTNTAGFVLVEDTGRLNGLNADNVTVNVYPCFRLTTTPDPVDP